MLRQLLKSPNVFFQTLRPESLNNKTLFLGAACLWFGILCESGMQFLLSSTASTVKPMLELIPLKQFELIKKEALLTLGLSPVIAFFGIYLFASALHVVLRGFNFVRSNNFNYETTLYLCALCQVPMLFCIIPVIGPPVASVWVFVLLMKAMRQVYGLSNLEAFASILPPALFLKLSWNSALQLLALSV
jgi:hypothetical protein